MAPAPSWQSRGVQASFRDSCQSLKFLLKGFALGMLLLGQSTAVEFSPKQNESRRGAWLLPSTTSFYFLRSNCTENLSMQLLQDRELKIHLKQNKTRRGIGLLGKNFVWEHS